MKKLLLSMFCALGLLSAGAATLTQEFTTGIGLPDLSSSVPKEATEYTATNTGIKYTLYGAYANSGYLMLNGKNYEGAFVQFALDFDCTSIAIATTSGCSTNANNKVNFYVNGTLVQSDIAVNVQSSTVNVAVPAEYQKAGSVYKFQYDKPASGSSYNSQFASFTYSTDGEVPDLPDQPVTPPTPTEQYTVAQALALLASGQNNIKAQVKGIISEIQEISTSFGNATYFIKDALTDADALEVYRGYSIDGAKFTKADEIAVGGTVVVEGTLVDYNGTYEFTTGSSIISYTAPQGGGTDEPVTPPVTGDETTATFTFSSPATLTPSYPADKGSSADGSTGNTQEIVSGVTFTEGAVTITPTKGSTDAKIYYQSSGKIQLRVYKGSTITIASTGVITKVEYAFNNTSSVVSYNGTSSTGSTFSFDVNAAQAVFNVDANSQINAITVTYVGGEAPAVAAPVIKCADNKVSIECVTEGAEIYYTTDGTTPSKSSTKYTAPFAITANTVVKAIAYVDADASNVTTFTATYVGNYAGFEAFVAGGSGTEGTVDGPLTAVFQSGQYLYVVDGSNYPMLVYGTVSATDIVNGDKIASVTGKYSPYNGLPELTNPVLGEITKGGTPVEPEILAAEEIATDMVNMFVQFDNMTLATTDGKNYTIEDETGSVALYSRFTDVTIPTDVDMTYTVRGFVSIYNTTIQLYPTEFIATGTAIERAAAPTFSPAGGAVLPGTEVTITSATEGATIFYTTDGTEPSIESTLYSAPVKVDAAMTIKAIAIKEGMESSFVSTAAYTLIDPNASSSTFDFTDQTWLTNEGISLPTTVSTGTDIAGNSYTVNAATISFPENTAANKARIWLQTGGDVQLRVFAGDNFVISVAEGYKLTSIAFTCPSTYMNFAPAEGTEGTFDENGVWTAPADETAKVTAVTFAPTKASRINNIEVSYVKTTDGIADEMTDDLNAPAEYYNLQGVRVDNPAAGNLYIVRQGTKVSKVIIR